MDEVILVDQNNKAIGTMEKLEAHKKGLLHRAFSVFIFNNKGELLLQQRALSKYHSAGLWTNTCCSHPKPGEETLSAAKRRLQEEMGITCDLHYKLHFIYKTDFENGLTEHEFDHVFYGAFDGTFDVNREEVESYRWATPLIINAQIAVEPQKFTSWFKIAMEKLF